MLAVASYPPEFVARCRSMMDAQLDGYDRVTIRAAPAAVDPFDQIFFQHLVLVLDHYFMHRLRGREGKDGNPMNEVRMLSASILEHDGVLTADKAIKYRPDQSVLKLQIGEPIMIERVGFGELCAAYFDAIGRAFAG